jgi:hypothetical protein
MNAGPAPNWQSEGYILMLQNCFFCNHTMRSICTFWLVCISKHAHPGTRPNAQNFCWCFKTNRTSLSAKRNCLAVTLKSIFYHVSPPPPLNDGRSLGKELTFGRYIVFYFTHNADHIYSIQHMIQILHRTKVLTTLYFLCRKIAEVIEN